MLRTSAVSRERSSNMARARRTSERIRMLRDQTHQVSGRTFMIRYRRGDDASLSAGCGVKDLEQ
jgi:hypothetical protein